VPRPQALIILSFSSEFSQAREFCRSAEIRPIAFSKPIMYILNDFVADLRSFVRSHSHSDADVKLPTVKRSVYGHIRFYASKVSDNSDFYVLSFTQTSVNYWRCSALEISYAPYLSVPFSRIRKTSSRRSWRISQPSTCVHTLRIMCRYGLKKNIGRP